MEQERTNRRPAVQLPVPVGTIVFYAVFFLFIAAFLIGTFVGLNALEDWLVNFESAQSNVKSHEVFQELFQDPDWAELYTTTGQNDTAYENVNAYVAYMDKLVGDRPLQMIQTSTGLDKTREKYLVRLDNKNIADFILINKSTDETQPPQWELESVNLYYERLEQSIIVTKPGHKVFVNGVELGQDHVISTTSTVAEKYLSSGMQGYRQQVLRISGLLVQPVVTIQDENGQPVTVEHDSTTNIYAEPEVTVEPTQEITDLAITVAQTYAKYMNTKDVTKGQILKYLDTQGKFYPTIPDKWELFTQSYNSYRFSDPIVTDYYAYSDDYYSIRVNMTLTITRTDGTDKDYGMDTHFFYKKNASGQWLVYETSNENIQERISQVKLDYRINGATIHSEFISSTAKQITLPTVQVPEGKEFLGWFTKEVDANGKTTMHLAFAPTESGVLYLADGNKLEPMELYAQFGAAKAQEDAA